MSDHRTPRPFQSLAHVQRFFQEQDPKPGSSYGLERIEQAVERLHHPERHYQVIHVGGTSGKGSTCVMIASILQAAGYSVGRYTSPALLTPLERIVVNDKAISERTALRLINRLWPQIKDLSLTHFELFTVLAFSYFAERKVDYAVIEVGVGGKLDATNVVQPTVAVVTDVGLDHTELLGKTKRLIAQDKQAIIKPGCIGLTGSPLVQRGTYVPLNTGRLISNNLSGIEFHYKRHRRLRLGMVGSYQVRNAILAIEVAQRLGVASQAIRYGLRTAYLPGRFEVIHKKPVVIIDGAHNPQKMLAFTHALKQMIPLQHQRVVALCAIKQTKDSYHTLKPLLPLLDEMILTTFAQSHSMAELERVIRRLNRSIKIHKIANATKAYQQLRRQLGKDDVGIVTGSLYLIGKLYPVF